MRRWKRYKVDMRVKLRRSDEPEEAATVVRTYEMSEGGLSVYASESYEVGAQMLAVFSLPGAEAGMRLRTIVKNRRGFRCGMEFVDLQDVDRSEILRYLGSLMDVIEI
jgi:c-di-GMP-binding flagellar brake protein YcgR